MYEAVLRVPAIYVLSKNKKIKLFYLKISIFTAFKNLCIMHGNVCVMENRVSRNEEAIHVDKRNKIDILRNVTQYKITEKTQI